MANLTPWFPPEVKPEHVGVYETMGGGIGSFQYWDGKYWGRLAASTCEAEQKSSDRSYFQDESWRGLAEQPKDTK